MKINEAGIALLKQFEGLRLTVYADMVGLPTVGWGHMDKTMKVGDIITEERAEELLRQDLEAFESGIDDALQVEVTGNEFSALVCFAYNVGLHAATSSHLMTFLNNGDTASAADQFLRWDRAAGEVVPGLLRRRQAERALFLA